MVLLLALACADSKGDGPRGFDFNGEFYGLSCAAVRPEFVAKPALGTATTTDDIDINVHQVEGIAPDLLVVADLPAGACHEGEEVRTTWSMASPIESARTDQLRTAICRVGDLSERQRRANECP